MLNLLHDHLKAVLSKTYGNLDVLTDTQESEIETLRNQTQEVLEAIRNAKSNFDNLKESNEFMDENKKNALGHLFEIGKNNTEFIAYLSNVGITIETLKESVIINIYYAMQKKLEEVVNIITDTYITIRNKLPRTAYPQEGNLPPPPGEGTRIKMAAKKIYDLVSVINEHKIEDEKYAENTSKKIADQMFLLFWYPRIPEKILVKSKIEGLTYRDNDLNNLYEVTAMHIDLIFTCHPQLLNRLLKERIVKNFVELIARTGKIEYKDSDTLITSDYHWKMSINEFNEFHASVNKLLNSSFSLSYDPDNSSRPTTPTSSSSNNSSSSSRSSLERDRLDLTRRALSDEPIETDSSDTSYFEEDSLILKSSASFRQSTFPMSTRSKSKVQKDPEVESKKDNHHKKQKMTKK